MRKLKRWIRSFFGFSRNQTNGFLILMPLMLLILLSEPVYEWLADGDVPLPEAVEAELDSVLLQLGKAGQPEEEKPPPRPFYFDPNVASAQQLTSLGFPKYIADRIVRYRTNGGRFTSGNDLYRIYGIDSQRVADLLPFVRLPEEKTKTIPASPMPAEPLLFDLNLADTTQLKTIRGIGSVLSARIIRHRGKLGGFVSFLQLHEIYGLDSTVIGRLEQRSFIAPGYEPAKVNINTATESELAAHPYLGSRFAKAIVAYRFQHGSFTDIDDLNKIEMIEKDWLVRARPYLSVK